MPPPTTICPLRAFDVDGAFFWELGPFRTGPVLGFIPSSLVLPCGGGLHLDIFVPTLTRFAILSLDKKGLGVQHVIPFSCSLLLTLGGRTETGYLLH